MIFPKFLQTLLQGSRTFWKILEFFGKIFRTQKMLKNDFGPGKFWNLLGRRRDAMVFSCLVFVIRS